MRDIKVSVTIITSYVAKYMGKIGFIPTTSQVVICKRNLEAK